MNPNEIRKKIRVDLFSRGNAHNGYYEKLGIQGKMPSVFGDNYDINLFALDNLKKKFDIADELIKKYKLEGNDLNNEIAFQKLKTDVDLIFKPKSFFSFFS